MAVDVVRGESLLGRGRTDVLRVQVGYRPGPEDRAERQFLLDVPAPEEGRLDEERVLAALEPAVYAGAPAPRHHSVHVHRWHTSWGARPGGLEVGVLVTVGRTVPSYDGVVTAFRDLLALVEATPARPLTRSAALHRARCAVASAYDLPEEQLRLSSEEHRPAENAWLVELWRDGHEYLARVGFVDGHPGSVDVRHRVRREVADAIGNE